MLGALAARSGARRALEVGHFEGRSTAVLLENLPAGCTLTTIDHHGGDRWMPAYSPTAFYANVQPYINRPFTFTNADMMLALHDLAPGWDFVFYDADHELLAMSAFWAALEPLLAEHCLVVFDDADWEDQGQLTDLAAAAGFEVIDLGVAWVRHPLDKQDPRTFTLQAMGR